MEGTIKPSGTGTPATLDCREDNEFGKLEGYSISKKDDEILSGVDPDDPYFQFSKPGDKKNRASSIEEAASDQEEEKSEARGNGKTDKFLTDLDASKNG